MAGNRQIGNGIPLEKQRGDNIAVRQPAPAPNALTDALEAMPKGSSQEELKTAIGKLSPEDRCTQLLGQIDQAKVTLAAKRPLNRAELEKIRENFIAAFTYNSNAIEGNTLTLAETALVLQGVTISSKPVKEHLEAIGHRDAYLYIEKIVKDNPPITEELIKTLHSFVLLDEPLERGNYRTSQVMITGAVHTPPQAEFVPSLMKDLIADLQQSKLHAVEQAAMFHLDFEALHPFVDGNGRTGRLLMNLSLMKEGFLPINIKLEDRSRYYQAFRSYHTTHSPIEMINLTAEYALDALQSRLNIIDGKEAYIANLENRTNS
jgi:Fic family protein